MTTGDPSLLLLLFLAFGSLVFWGLIYPIIILADIVKEKSPSWKKLFWTTMIVLFAPLSAPIWALIYSQQRWKKWNGVIGIVALTVVCIWCGKLATDIVQQMRELPQTVETSLQFQSDVTDKMKQEVHQGLEILSKDLEKSGFSDFYKLSLDYRLVLLLYKMNEDGLSGLEVQKWIYLFEKRDTLDPMTFNPDLELTQ